MRVESANRHWADSTVLSRKFVPIGSGAERGDRRDRFPRRRGGEPSSLLHWAAHIQSLFSQRCQRGV